MKIQKREQKQMQKQKQIQQQIQMQMQARVQISDINAMQKWYQNAIQKEPKSRYLLKAKNNWKSKQLWT